MLFVYSVIIVTGISLLLFAILNFKKVKAYVRFRTLLEKLPGAQDRKWIIGHADKVFGIKMEQGFQVIRDWLQENSSFVIVGFLGPFLQIVGVTGPQEIEAIIGQMKNMEKSYIYNFLRRWLNDGLLTSKGSKWQQRRKILTPAFHFSILVQFVDIFNKETNNFIKQIEEKYLNRIVDIAPLISDYTLLTMLETSMGISLDLDTLHGQKYKNAIRKLTGVFFYRMINPILYIQWIFNLTAYRKSEKKYLKVLHGFTDNIIEKRSKDFKTFDDAFDNFSAKKKYPLMDILLNAKFKYNSIDNAGIREEVDTFMFEGHDTTAMCLNFTTMLLACHKKIQDEVYREIVDLLGHDTSKQPSYADLQNLNLLERCIKESLRLYPPVPLIGRITSEEIPTKFGTIPKGVNLMGHIYDIHRNPDFWPNPDVFDPARHLPENSVDRNPFAFIPFSAGPRNCIGQRFAMLEIKSFFCGLSRKFVLEPVDTPETIKLSQDLILRSKNGIKVKFILRNNN